MKYDIKITKEEADEFNNLRKNFQDAVEEGVKEELELRSAKRQAFVMFVIVLLVFIFLIVTAIGYYNGIELAMTEMGLK